MLLFSCQQASKQKDGEFETKKEQSSSTTPKHLSNWSTVINNGDFDSIKQLYLDNSIKVLLNDSILNGSSEIANYYVLRGEQIVSVKSLFQVDANQKKDIHYEVIKLQTDKSNEYVQLTIWESMKNNKVVDFEFIAEKDVNSELSVKDTIAKRRELWMELCNVHDTEALVNQLYSENTLYYNHKPLVKGREQMISTYSYMNNPNYSLTLQPLFVEMVNDTIVYEIGQCEGSYNGKYILIWQKGSDGEWRIFIDSNI